MPKQRTRKPQLYASKAEFVRSVPRSMSAADVIAQAKSAGLKLTHSDVYAARTAERTKQAKAAIASTRPARVLPRGVTRGRVLAPEVYGAKADTTSVLATSVANGVINTNVLTETERLFAECVRRLGTERAQAFLSALDKPITEL